MKIETPLKEKDIAKLKAGDRIYLTGYIYTARDAAHKKMIEEYITEEKLPIPIKNEIIYYTGPTPKRKDQIIGSAGPTTSYRMDDYTPLLMSLGLKGTIGKGKRSKEVIEAIKKNKGLYLGATGGLGALISKKIKENNIIAYEELGTEAIRRIYVKEMPLTVIIDSNGKNIYERLEENE